MLLVARVLGFALIAVPALVRVPLPKLARLLPPRRPPRTSHNDQQDVVHAVETALALAARAGARGCLRLGLTRFFFLTRAGIDVTLAFGLDEREGTFVGHCWLERDGVPYLEPTDADRFPAIFRIPA